MTETTDKTKTEAPKVVPPAQPVATIKRAEAWETFRDELTARADEIGTQLPPNLPRDRFLGAALAAVKSNPDILLATPRSLMSALTKAAQDGLLPDGREGIITTYEQKVKGSNPERKEHVASWNPMFYGIRKRAKEIDGIIIDAQVVYVGDEFEFELGDAPFIKHKPKARTAKVDAAAGVAAYAIFRDADQRIIHREVMFKFDIFDVMNQSRAKTSLMWTTFWTEGWRKVVGRRGAKTVPMSPALERLIQRDDDNFVFDQLPPTNGPSRPTIPDPSVPTAPKVPDPSTTPSGAPTEPPKDGAVEDFNDDDSGVTVELHGDALLDQLQQWLDIAKDEATIEETWSELDIESEFAHDVERMGKAIEAKTAALARLNRTAAGNNGQAEMNLGGGTPAADEFELTHAQKIAGTP